MKFSPSSRYLNPHRHLPMEGNSSFHAQIACDCSAPRPHRAPTPVKDEGISPSHSAPLSHEWTWVETAFSDEHLRTYFQPIVCAYSGEIEGYETLMRSQIGSELIGAGELIAACQEWNVLSWMDKHARLAAIRAVATAFAAPVGNAENDKTRYFINFLPSIVYDPAVCLKTTMAEAAKYDISPNHLVFEVSESEPIQSMAHLKNVLAYYRDHGAQTAVDDLGMGYATADYLPLLCPDYLKISLEWLRRAENDITTQNELRALIAAAQEQKAKVIIEGVETGAQHTLCQQLGADFVQGFLHGRPAPHPSV